MRALYNWKKSFIVSKRPEEVSIMLRQRHGNDTRQLGGYIVMISERFMRVTDNSKKGSESGIRVRKESVRHTKKATTVDWKNYFLVLFAHVKKKS